MKLKKTIHNILLFCGIVAIGLCTAVAVKMPDVFPTLIGINNKNDSEIQSVPYYVNFGDLGTSDSSYKTQYFSYAKRSWYLSWGNFGSTNHSNENDNFNMLLGWNSARKPVYGGYSYVNEVMNNIEVKDDYNFSYVIMDFDFNLNHQCDFTFSALENLTNTDSTIYFISSHNKGSTWNVLETLDSSKLIKDEIITFNNVEDNLISRTTRYGLVLVSNGNSVRIELDQFVVQRLSVV